MDIYNIRAFAESTPLLGYTAAKWLSLIFPKSHPDYELIEDLLKFTEDFNNQNKNDVSKEKLENDHNKFRELAGEKPLIYFESEKELKETLKKEFGTDEEFLKTVSFPEKVAMGSNPVHGIEIIGSELNCIKDDSNPFYDKNEASKNAISFYVVKHCSSDMLRQLEEHGFLDDACAKSVISDERSHGIIHDNWEFIYRYFVREI